MKGKQVENIASAAALQYFSKAICIFLQLFLQAVLARLLVPEDFGLVAIVAVFIAFFNILSDLGIGPAIIQFRDLGKRDYGALFVFSIGLAVGLSIIFCGLSFVVSAIYAEQRFVALLSLSSIAVFFTTINLVPNGLLLKERRFVTIAVRQIIVNFIGVSVAVIMALAGAGCFSLIAFSIVVAIAVFFWNIIGIWREMELCVSGMLALLRKIFRYSAFQSAWGIINYFSRNLDNLLIAGVMGSSALGYYDRAYKLTTYPLTNISSVLASILQPFLAELQDNYEALFVRYVDITKLMSLFGCFVAAVCIFCPKEVVLLFYGEQWGASVPLFQLLSFSVMFQMIDNVVAPVLQSAGRTDVLFVSGGIATCVTISAILIGVLSGDLVLLSASVATAYTVHFGIYVYFLVFRLFKRPVLGYLKLFVPEILYLLSCFCITLLVNMIPEVESWSLISLLMLKVSFFIAIYLVLLLAFKQIRYIKRAFRR